MGKNKAFLFVLLVMVLVFVGVGLGFREYSNYLDEKGKKIVISPDNYIQDNVELKIDNVKDRLVLDDKTVDTFAGILNTNSRIATQDNQEEGHYVTEIRFVSDLKSTKQFSVYDNGDEITFSTDNLKNNRDKQQENVYVTLKGKKAEFAKLVMANDAKANTFSWSNK